MIDQLKVGDVVARCKTRKVVVKETDKKDVPFKIAEIRGRSVIGDDGNNHAYGALYPAEELRTEHEEREKKEGEGMKMLSTPVVVTMIAAGVFLSASGFAMGRMTKR